MSSVLCVKAVVVSSCVAGGAMAGPVVVFSDTFDAENGGAPATNYTGFSAWSVTQGTVDLIGLGSGGELADIYAGNGLYVDLDGSTRESGGLVSTSLDLVPGVYELTFELGDANFAFGETDLNEMRVSVGSLYSETFTTDDANADALVAVTRSFTVTTAQTVELGFEHLSHGYNFGMIIDDVSIVLVPTPGTLALLGLAGIPGLIRRR